VREGTVGVCERLVKWSLPCGPGMIKRLPFDSNIRASDMQESSISTVLCVSKNRIYRGESTSQICAHTLGLFDQAVTCRYAAFFRPFTFVHLARRAAAIFLRDADDTMRLGLAASAWPFCAAHRAFCARLIFLRAAADIVRRCPFETELPNAARAARNRPASFSALSNSFFNC
jgi:hypothetical protein